MKRSGGFGRNERGAILAQGAIIFLGLLAITTFVVDYGVLWVGRHQAQNSADAGALAGATALFYDSMTDRTDAGPAKQSAYHVAHGNYIVGQSPNIDITTDITFPTCPDGSNRCIKVNVFRNEQRGNALPMIFGRIVGLGAQGVRATATGEAAVGNASNCLKPWVIVDRWQEDNVPPSPTTFDKWQKQGNNITQIANPDAYIPSSSDPPSLGSGYNTQYDLGAELTLKVGNPQGAITPGFYYPIDLPVAPTGNVITGGAQYRTNIATCTGYPVSIGDTVVPENGNMVGPTAQGVAALVALDPNAQWDSTNKTIINSCATATPSCGPISPRVVAIAMVNPDPLQYSMLSTGGKNLQLTVVNILGFFVNAVKGNGDVTGYLTMVPGLTIGTPTINPGNAFTVNIMLVR